MLPNPSKAYFVLVRLLKRRGLNTSAWYPFYEASFRQKSFPTHVTPE
jgi:hypothetical protein